MRHGGAAFAVPEGVEDELIALLAQGWMVAPDSALEFEFGEKTAVVSRIRVVKKRKPKAG